VIMLRQSARSGLRPDQKNHRNFPQTWGVLVVVSGKFSCRYTPLPSDDGHWGNAWPAAGGIFPPACLFFDIWILSRTVPGCPGEACPLRPATWKFSKFRFLVTFGHVWSSSPAVG